MNFSLFIVLVLSIQNLLKADWNEPQETGNERSKTRKSRGGKNRRSKADRVNQIISYVESNPISIQMTAKSWSASHNSSSNVILTVAISKTLMRRDAKHFVTTARRTGFDGDIVVAVDPLAREDFIDELRLMKCVVYEIPTQCGGKSDFHEHDVDCSFGFGKVGSINMIRYYLYQIWATKYSPESLILLSDFNDVFFQSNPFTYHLDEWFPENQLVVFLEAHPNVIIKRQPHNRMWVENCYGSDILRKIGSYTVSCSGNTMGTRNGILAYLYLMNKQMDPEVRYNTNNPPKDHCLSPGMDQGFHNYLLYSGGLNKFLDIKIYQQGEGAVNVMGGFWGSNKILQFSLEQWKIMTGTSPNKFIYNWDGHASPVVHQLNRYLASGSELARTDYVGQLAVFQNLYNK
eukprot:gene12537-16815_t